MIKDIRYSGFATAPSDYDCPDGQLAVSLGAIVEDGALHPIRKPSEVFTLENGHTVLALHDGRYIIADSARTQLSWKGGEKPVKFGSTDTPVTQVTSLGNTLVALTANGPVYFLWSDGAYKTLGSKIPDVDISFGLIGRPRLFSVSDESKSTFTVSGFSIKEDDLNKDFSEDIKRTITEQIMAKVNRFLSEQSVQKGRFSLPFFVRYALRLYDGSLVMHSAPILMNPCTKGGPTVFLTGTKGSEEKYSEFICDIMLMAATLDYQFLQTNESKSLANWKDIVKSVDVYISRPIYTYDQEGYISNVYDLDNVDSVFIGKLYASNGNKEGVTTIREEDKLLGTFDNYDFLDYYAEWKYKDIYKFYFSKDNHRTFHLPEFSENKVRETLQNTASFYKLCSIPIEELTDDKSMRTEIVVDDEYLQSLTNREVMTDDYLTHDRITAEDAYIYNNRLNLSGLNRKPFRGFYAESMFAYCNTSVSIAYIGESINVTDNEGANQEYEIIVCIKEDGIESIVKSDLSVDYYKYAPEFGTLISYLLTKSSFGCYLFYPNANAYKMIVRQSGGGSAYEVKLTPHEFLNGAYCLLDYEMVRDNNITDLPDIAENIFPMPNKLYTSEVNNPFYFPLSGINTVGTGRIIGISSAAKALSEGQFGQFPLYTFTTEGVWAMEVVADGTYSARQPISRDVCTGRESITQMDSSVLFATERGIMQISGSAVSCITDSIDADKPFSPASLPLLHLISQEAANFKATPLRQFVKGCSMVYDYTNQQVIVCNPAYGHALVLSLKSGQWAHMDMKIDRAVPSYPNALAMMKNTLVDFSNRLDEEVQVSLITRPFKLDAPDIHKTIRQIIQRGVGNTGIQALYASNDLQNWVSVWACNGARMGAFSGTPYKYFRMALSLEAKADTSLSGFSVDYLPKLTDRLR